MKTVTPQFSGYKFWIYKLDGGGNEVFWYGYNIKSKDHNEAGGAYESIELATRAALARIETLAFDNKCLSRCQ